MVNEVRKYKTNVLNYFVSGFMSDFFCCNELLFDRLKGNIKINFFIAKIV